MTDITRRNFLKKAGLAGLGGLALAGSGLYFPGVVEATEKCLVRKELIKRALEPHLDQLTKKIIQIESNWDYWKKRKDTEATGLMQIRPVVIDEWNKHGPGRQYNEYDLFDPYTNVNVGQWYLHERIGKHYLPHYGLKVNEENLAASFNAGPVRIGEDIGDAIENFDKLPEQTQGYLKKLWKLS